MAEVLCENQGLQTQGCCSVSPEHLTCLFFLARWCAMSTMSPVMFCSLILPHELCWLLHPTELLALPLCSYRKGGSPSSSSLFLCEIVSVLIHGTGFGAQITWIC